MSLFLYKYNNTDKDLENNMPTMTITSNGTSSAIPFNGTMESTYAFYGTFGGGKLTIEASFDGGTTYIPVPKQDETALEITANSIKYIKLSACLLRFKLVDATNPNIKISIA